MIVKILDNDNKIRNIGIIAQLGYKFKEDSKVDKEDYKYIGIENKEKYLRLWTITMYFILFLTIVISIIILIIYMHRLFQYIINF
ncbi:hypothetical protein Ga0061079_105160 [Apibacter mensalis]|uniref:Uncharacterized protein n=1 Tax=Apibacter mensalis TaxID=1586267 RepID=A0A0X3APB9_9FLAO|nr:hypothetical protein Ga0061079_105160 [Apibacter mensalis]